MGSRWKSKSTRDSNFASTTRVTAELPICGTVPARAIREPIFSSQRRTSMATVFRRITSSLSSFSRWPPWGARTGSAARGADLQLSKAYIDGNGVPQDYQLAFEFLKMAADWNLPEAQFLMGEHYYRDGTPDYVSAYLWYALSKRAGGQDGEAMLKTLASEMSPEQLSEAELRVDYWPKDPPNEPQ